MNYLYRFLFLLYKNVISFIKMIEFLFIYDHIESPTNKIMLEKLNYLISTQFRKLIII